MWCSIPAGTALPPSSAIAVGTAGVHGDRVPGAGRPDELPQAVAEVLHLAGTQRTAHTQELGSRPAGTQVSAGAIAERLTPGRGQAGHLGLHFPGPQAERLGEITPNLRIPKEQE